MIDAELPAGIVPMLTRMFREFGPVLANTLERLSAFEIPKGRALPRAIGTHAFRIGMESGRVRDRRWRRVVAGRLRRIRGGPREPIGGASAPRRARPALRGAIARAANASGARGSG